MSLKEPLSQHLSSCSPTEVVSDSEIHFTYFNTDSNVFAMKAIVTVMVSVNFCNSKQQSDISKLRTRVLSSDFVSFLIYIQVSIYLATFYKCNICETLNTCIYTIKVG